MPSLNYTQAGSASWDTGSSYNVFRVVNWGHALGGARKIQTGALTPKKEILCSLDGARGMDGMRDFTYRAGADRAGFGCMHRYMFRRCAYMHPLL